MRIGEWEVWSLDRVLQVVEKCKYLGNTDTNTGHRWPEIQKATTAFYGYKKFKKSNTIKKDKNGNIYDSNKTYYDVCNRNINHDPKGNRGTTENEHRCRMNYEIKNKIKGDKNHNCETKD